MSRVFVVHEPLNKEMEPTKDLRPAEVYGELTHCVPSGPTPHDLNSLLPSLRKTLADFTADDFILPIGHPILIGWVTAIAANNTGGKVSLLYWKNGHYTCISANLGEPQ